MTSPTPGPVRCFEITDSEFRANHVEASGGAIVSDGDGELIIAGSDFTENFAPAEGGAIIGGGRSSIAISDSRFVGNQSSGSGGAISFEGERSGSITDTLFRENVAGVNSVDELGFPVEGDGTGGGLHTGASGPFTIEDSTFERNEAHGDGGALGIHSSGTVRVTDTVIRDNHARGEEAGGGGVENSGERVTFTRVLVTGNTATGNGGGIHNTSSNEFSVVDTTITDNKAENGGGFANASDSTLTIRGSLIANNLARVGPRDTHGHGGGLYSIGDAGGIVENTTISGNTARVRGGGVYNDADGELRMANVTIWRNSAPFGGGVGVMESDAVPTVPPTPLTGLIIVRNSIVAGSIQGGGCDGAVKSEGGNLDMGSVCFTYEPQSSDIIPVGDRMNAAPQLDALADNGGPTLTHALREGSVGIDGGVNTVTTILGTMDTCPDVDQRNLPRPVNDRCDVGAFEHQGPFPPKDLLPPDTTFESGPAQVTEETMAFTFSGRDDESAIGFTPPEELTFECRLLELDPTEPPEPTAPGEPIDPGARLPRLLQPVVGAARRGGQLAVRGARRRPRRSRRPDAGEPSVRHDQPGAAERGDRRGAGERHVGPLGDVHVLARSTTSRRRSSWSTSAVSTPATPRPGWSASTRWCSPTWRRARTRSRCGRRTRRRTSTRRRRGTPGRSARRRTATRPTSA